MRLWSILIVLAFATAIGIWVKQDPGYALFAYRNWTIEMPLWVSAVLFMMAVILTLTLLWLINTLFLSSGRIKKWWKKHQEQTARLQTYRGLLELAEGRWQKAERLLKNSAKHNETPLINYLSAAKAAEESNAPERRDHYLQLAFDASAGSNTLVRLTQAQLQLKHGELDRSVENLERLYKETPKHPKVLKLLCTLYEAMNDWQALLGLLPALYKTKVLPQETLTDLEQKIYQALLPVYSEKGLNSLLDFWKRAGTSVKQNPFIVCDYVYCLIKHQAQKEGEAVLRLSLKQAYHDKLILLYGLMDGPSSAKQLQFVESLLPNHFDNPAFLLTLGRLCFKNQLWGKAKEYLEQSLALKPTPSTFAALGQLMEKLDLPQERDAYYKKGLFCLTEHLSPLSMSPFCLTYEDGLK